MKNSTSPSALIVAATALIFEGLARAEGESASTSNGGDGVGLILLVGFVIWLAISVKSDEKIRCPRCNFRATKKKFSSGSCPACGTEENFFR